MSENGFNVVMGPLKTLMFDLVTANAKEKKAMKSRGAGGRNKEVLASDRMYVEAMVFLSVECGFDAMEMRKGDCYSLMHLAAEGDLPQMVLCLLQLGCDVNCVARDDSMPLMLALKAGARDTAKILKLKGAKETWRKDVKQIVPTGWGDNPGRSIKAGFKGGVKREVKVANKVDGVAQKVAGLKLSMGNRIESSIGKGLEGVKEEGWGEEEEEEEEGEEEGADYNKYTFSCE